MCIYLCGDGGWQGVRAWCRHAMEYVWRSEGNLQESVLSFHRVGPGHQAQVFGFVGKAFIHH